MKLDSNAVPPRLDPSDVARTLKAANLRARHALSQNFLTDTTVLEAILREARPSPGRRILEIGPGLGILTRALLGAGAAVTAVELDRGLASFLREHFADELGGGSLRLVEGDVLDQDLASIVQPPFDVVANLPYHITSPVLHRLFDLPTPPELLVLMVQREVAERIAAAPGAMSYLSVFVQYHATARVVLAVPRAAFEPQPKVDSAVLVLEGRPEVRVGRAPDDLWRLVQAGFRERRKMLHNVLARQLPMDGARLDAALREAGIAGDRRPQTLSVEDWQRLLEVLGPLPADQRGRRRDPVPP